MAWSALVRPPVARVKVRLPGSLSVSAGLPTNSEEGPLLYSDDALCVRHGTVPSSREKEVYGMAFGTGAVTSVTGALGDLGFF